MKQNLFFIIPLFFLFNVNLFADPTEKKIISQLYAKYETMYQKYQGVESLKIITTYEYEAKTKKLKNKTEVKIIEREYFYKKAESKIISYKKNGKKISPQKYRQRSYEPGYPIFDKNGKKNYHLKLVGSANIRGIECYKIEIIPLKETSRHLKGFQYFSKNNLDMLYCESTVAKLPWPLTSLQMKFYYTNANNLFTLYDGLFTLSLNVPLYPEIELISQTKVIESHGI